jgi:hypothetical protein
MTTSAKPGIYLCIDFDWPQPFQPEHGQKARKLHDVVQNQNWIKAVVAASGGIGAGPTSTWIFWLADYAALERLLRDPENDVSRTYQDFFSQMPVVVDKIREEVHFL